MHNPATVARLVLEECERAYGVSPLSRSRTWDAIASRWTAAYILRTVGRFSYGMIVRTLGMKDHSTLVYALRRVHSRATREGWWDMVERIQATVLAKLQAEEKEVRHGKRARNS